MFTFSLLKLQTIRLLSTALQSKDDKARFIRRISAVSNAIETIDNEMICFIIFCLNCIRHGRNATYEPGLSCFIIHQTHYEKSDWSRAFNQFTIACELDMINAISAADIAFIVSSSTSAWLLSPWSVLLRNKMAERFASVSEDELCEKCIIIKTIIEFGFRMIS